MLVVNNKLRLFGFLFALFTLSVTAVIIAPQDTFAQGGVGSGGSGGGCGNGCGGAPHTNNGYGWYRFSSSGAGGPADLRNGGSYANVAATCRNTGNDSVVAFIVLRPNRLITSASIYDYRAGAYGTYTDYNGNDGGNWLPYAYAQALYGSLPGSITGGYTFGSNVAWFCYNFSPPPPPPPAQWTVEGVTYIQNGQTANMNLAVNGTVNAKPGDRLNWFHDLRNFGPNNMDRTVYYEVAKTGFTNGWNATILPNGNASGPASNTFVQLRAKDGAPSDFYTVYYVQQSDVGNTLCQRIQWISHSWNNGAAGANGFACGAVPFSYNLVPDIANISDGSIAESGSGAVPVTARVTNTGDTKSHPNIQWEMYQVKYAPGAAVNNKAGGVSAATPCAYFTGNIQCISTTPGSGVEAGGYDYHATATYNANGNIADEPAGTKICFGMSIKRNSGTSTDWRHSQLYCMVVAKKPKVQVLGGDLIVGRGSGVVSNIVTSTSRLASTGLNYGSWAEYGILPSGTVLGMASGARYVGGSPTIALCGLSVLTFTNSNAGSCNDTNVGRYSNSSLGPNIASRFPVSSSTQSINTASMNITGNAMQGVYKTSLTSLSLASSADIPAGKWVVINAPNTTVTISGNIRYTTSAIPKVGSIPQVVIIAKNIIIADAVTNVDAWLIAAGTGIDGRINTCGAGGVAETTVVTTLNCNQMLTVNGPVVANHLIMRRTAGAGVAAQARDPAEVFNLRPDAYFWASVYSTSSASRVPTASTKELPPRF